MDIRAFDRRLAITSLALCALAPLVAVAPTAMAAAARAPVVVPQGEWVLTRVVERGLGGGAKIVVTRSWKIRFARATEGMIVTGEQIAVRVDAPPKLAALAEIERKRKADELFPAELDRTGLIQRMADGSNPADVAKAVAIALDRLKQTGDHGQSLADHRSFLLGVNRMTADTVSRIPTDLFFPAPGSSESERKVPLADGETGRVHLVHSAATRRDSPLLARSERRIVTTIAGEARVSSEVWTLTPSA